jgi:NAD+ diphosphatase
MDMAVFIPSHSAPESASVHRYFHVIGASVWVDAVPGSPDWSAHFLGMLGDEACWGVDVPHGHDPADGAAIDLRSFFGRTSEAEWLVAGRAVQLVEWARTHRFCGRVAHRRSSNRASERCVALRAGCWRSPIAPAMITLVTRGDKALLAAVCVPGSDVQLSGRLRRARRVAGRSRFPRGPRGGGHRGRQRSLLGSQPWPFPQPDGRFMAEWSSGEIEIDLEIVARNGSPATSYHPSPAHLDRPQTDRRLARRTLSRTPASGRTLGRTLERDSRTRDSHPDPRLVRGNVDD